ncbi:hypothetical protein [Aeromonas phage 14AhydR10PP]|nr:hypothetical protein [Aeromonas phage 14AhydR10PP]
MSSRPICQKCDQYVPCSCPTPFEVAFGAAVRQSIREQGPGVVMTTPRAGMSIAADYFGIEGPSCAEVAASIRKAHEEQVGPVGPTGETLALCLSTATQEQLCAALSAIQHELVSRSLKVWGKPVFGSPLGEFRKGHLTQWTPPSADMVMTELEDPDSMLNQGLADALDARELELDACYPYLREDVHIESCPIVGKGAVHNCKHLIGRLDYCDRCEREHDEPIDFSGESI